VPTILAGHHPWFVESADEDENPWNLPPEPRRTLLELARRHSVRLALAGHRHRNAVAHDGPFEMVTSGPVGYPLGNDPSGYRIIDVHHGEISHAYYALPPD
jgi:predicted phosphodiesterase